MPTPGCAIAAVAARKTRAPSRRLMRSPFSSSPCRSYDFVFCREIRNARAAILRGVPRHSTGYTPCSLGPARGGAEVRVLGTAKARAAFLVVSAQLAVLPAAAAVSPEQASRFLAQA